MRKSIRNDDMDSASTYACVPAARLRSDRPSTTSQPNVNRVPFSSCHRGAVWPNAPNERAVDILSGSSFRKTSAPKDGGPDRTVLHTEHVQFFEELSRKLDVAQTTGGDEPTIPHSRNVHVVCRLGIARNV